MTREEQMLKGKEIIRSLEDIPAEKALSILSTCLASVAAAICAKAPPHLVPALKLLASEQFAIDLAAAFTALEQAKATPGLVDTLIAESKMDRAARKAGLE